MASYDAIINLRLKGLNQLKEVERAVNGITGKTRTGRARTGASSIVKKELSAEQERLKTLGHLIKLKRTEIALNRQIANQEAFIAKQNKKGVGPNNLLGLPSSKDLEGRAIQRLGNRGFIKGSQSTSKITDFTASSVQKAEFFEKRRNEAIAKGIANNNKLIGSERIRNAQLIKTNTAVQKAGENLIRLSDSFGKLSLSAGNLLPKTRTSSGGMLALPSAEMLDKRVRGSGQLGGFSRRIPRFRLPKPTRGFDMQSALISGAFPLLFGQGPVGALAGGLGGGIGGMFGQMGGFAGGIAATALVQQVQQLIGSLGNLGKAMGPFVQDTNALIDSMGLAGTAEAKRIQIIEQLQGKQAAFNAAMQKMNETVGTEATKRLKDFGEKASLVGSEFKIAMTRMQASLIPVINLVDRLFGISANAQRLQRERTIKNSKDVNIRSRVDEIDQLRGQTGGGRQAVKRRNDRIKLLERELKLRADVEIIETNIQTKADELTLEFAQHVKKIQEKADLEKEVAKLMAGGMKQSVAEQIAQNNVLAEQARKRLEVELEILKAKIADPDTEGKELTNAVVSYNKIKQTLQDIGVEQDKINKLTEKYGEKTEKIKITREEIANLLATETTNAIMGLIDGTKTLSESLAGVARQLASMFLNRAFSAMFGNFFGEQGGYSRSGGFQAFQYGGVVNSPTLGMVGEGGEPEYIIPASKMDGAMARYSAGARGGAVIPGGSHEAGTVAGASGSTVVEYTGPILNFNGDEYVPKDSVPQIINAAAKQGATLGQSRTLNTLKNSRSSRAKIGL